MHPPPPQGGDDHRTQRVVPVYALTGGRTRSSGTDLPLESLVTVTDRAAWNTGALQLEYRSIISLAAVPISLVEIGAHLRVPVGVARVLVSDLAEAGYLTVHTPVASENGGPEPRLLVRLLEGLRAR